MIAVQRVKKIHSTVKEAKEMAGKEMPKVEVVVEGKVVGLAEEVLARAVVMAIKFKKIMDEVEGQLNHYKDEIKILVREEGITVRPVKFRIRGVGEVVVSEKGASVSIADAKGVYEVLKDRFFEMVSFKAKKELIALACDADSEEGKELRKYLEVNTEGGDVVRVTAKKQ